MRKTVFKVINEKRESIFASQDDGYKLKYLKSFEVKGLPGTLGIFCFKRKIDALNFMGVASTNHNHSIAYLIIRVVPLGRGNRPKKIADKLNKEMFDCFYNDKEYCSIEPPPGTICYPSVLVLE